MDLPYAAQQYLPALVGQAARLVAFRVGQLGFGFFQLLQLLCIFLVDALLFLLRLEQGYILLEQILVALR